MTGRRPFQERAFAVLLRLYPRWFAERYGEEMRQLFGSRLARTSGVRGTMRLWLRTLADALSTMFALRRTRARSPRKGEVMAMIARDLRHAARHLMRAPLFTIGAIVLLAVGIGANTAVFTLVDALLFRPPPFDRPEEVVYVYQDSDDGEPSSNSFPAYRDMVGSPAFAAVAATSNATAAWEREGGPVEVVVEYTTASYLDVLGLRVSRGRWFLPEEDVVGNAPVAVVSEAAWRARLGAPAVRSARQSVGGALRDDRRSSATGRGTVRVRNALVAVQVGASLVLILGAGLLSRSLAALQKVDTGIDAERVAWVRTSFAQAGIAPAEAAIALDQLLERLASLPGATHAAAASRLPAQPSSTTTTIVDGYTPPTGTGALELNFSVVTPDYFETVGQPLLDGRSFAATDVQGTDRVVLINQTAARMFWGSADPIGRLLRSQSQPDLVRTVVGVVGDAPVRTISDISRPIFYIPAAQGGLSSPYLLVRTDGDPGALLGAIRDEVRGVRATLPIQSQGTLDAHFHDAVAGPRFAARLMSAVSMLAMLLAGLGTYAVVAFGVARRSAEMGIRMALGAGQGSVIRMVVGETAGTVLLGLAIGIGIAFLGAPRLEPILFGVAPLDPITFIGAVLLLTLVAGLAAYVPARRAARADPVRSLRAS